MDDYDPVIRVDYDVQIVRECLRVAGVVEKLYEGGGVPGQNALVHPKAGCLGNDDDVSILEPQRWNAFKLDIVHLRRLDLGVD